VRIHELKCWPEYFEPLRDGRKRFEYRNNDRQFIVGDLLRLREFNGSTQQYTGREATVQVDYIMNGEHFAYLTPGYVIMSITKVSLEVKRE